MPPNKRASDLPSELTDNDPSHMTDEQLADATAAAARDAGVTVRLALHRAFPLTAFDPSIKGVDPITADGTDVPAEHADAVIDAAKQAGLTVKKVSE